MTQYTMTVTYQQGVRNASTTFNGTIEGGNRYLVNPDDTIQIKFVGPGTVSGAMLNMLPMLQSDSASPFPTSTPNIPVANDQVLSVSALTGLWGFFMSFFASTSTPLGEFHFVPDPELQVGSIPRQVQQSAARRS